jgi:hypothetical protein
MSSDLPTLSQGGWILSLNITTNFSVVGLLLNAGVFNAVLHVLNWSEDGIDGNKSNTCSVGLFSSAGR